MPQQTTVAVPPVTWTQLTNGDATDVVFQNQSDFDMFVMATTDTTAPTVLTGALKYKAGQGEARTIAELFPGIALADRLWAYIAQGGQVLVSHA